MKLLVVKTSSLGDIIHTLPAVRDAAKAIPSLTIDWVTEQAFSEIPTWHLNVRRVIPVAWRRWRRHWRECTLEIGGFKRALQQEKYDKIIDAQGLIKSGLITFLAKGTRVGLDWSSLTEPLARIFYHQVVHVNVSELAITRMRHIFSKSLGYSLQSLPLDYGLKKFEQPYPLKQPYVFFAHGTTWPSRKWPFQHWLTLAQKIKQQGYFIYLSWYTDEEKQFANNLASKCNAVVVLPKQNLTKLAEIIAHATALVGVDTGLSHLAPACHTPSITLYGPTDPITRTYPTPSQLYLQANFDCLNCHKSVCHYKQKKYVQAQCLKACQPEQVLTQLLPLLNK